MSDLNPLFDPATDNMPIAAETQKMINTPLAGGALSSEDQMFLNHVLAMLEEKKIQVYSPSSLLNPAVYETLLFEEKAKVDQAAFNMLSKIRTIETWSKAGMEMNYQMENIIHALRMDKERLEAAKDVFII